MANLFLFALRLKIKLLDLEKNYFFIVCLIGTSNLIVLTIKGLCPNLFHYTKCQNKISKA
ncbi:hypothetical protein BpHYR1_013848 [Brachionus plicatilis]|uniref:Uncharacterized protein n=1 Tax=Brachionus plicatilis TaxID=10195 RepID=A0A3M7QCI4_BRAPC|nr:hypothetical protein BpHYR1_013848 [Brachionus plicatilis]